MKTILREHIPYGISLGVYPNAQEAIANIQDPHATLHQVPENICHEGHEQHLLDYTKAQKKQGFCFDVFKTIMAARAKRQAVRGNLPESERGEG